MSLVITFSLFSQVKKEAVDGRLIVVAVTDSLAFKKSYPQETFVGLGVHGYFKLAPQNLTSALKKRMEQDPNIIGIYAHEKPHVEASIDFTNPAFNRITTLQNKYPALTGVGSKISVKEENFDVTDVDLVGRTFTTSLTPSTTAQHATTMSVLIGGAGNSSAKGKGVATGVQLTATNFNNLLPDATSYFQSNNIYIQNHSYGVGIENYYGPEAAAYDQQVTDYPNLLHIFSAGNLGKSKPTAGVYKDFLYANLSGNFKQAKNVVLVNAVDSTLGINQQNSRGPAFDGRLKPELTAYGQGGTSEAAALTSGLATLLRERFIEKFSTAPSASLLKAILIASADDIGAKGIDFLYGYGSINADRAIQLVDAGQVSAQTLTSSNMVSVPIVVPTNTSELRVAVCWTDPPAALNATNVLINDVDTWLDTGTGSILPWVLNSFPHVDSLTKAPKRKADHLNNVEYITLENPAAGTYQLKIKAPVMAGSQPVSVAYWIHENKPFSWDYPLANDVLEGGKKSLLVWQANSAAVGDLYVQFNQGVWQRVGTQLNLSNYFYYKPPASLSVAKFKMVVGGIDYLSDEFVVSPAPKLEVAFVCADSVGLTWKKITNTNGYQLFTLGGNYLVPLVNTLDTLQTFQSIGSKNFSLAPIINGKWGLRSQLIDYTNQGGNCFLKLFDAVRTSGNEIRIQASLSSWYGIKNVVVIKTTRSGTRDYQTILPSSTLRFEFSDSDLVAGTMAYQLRVNLKNGGVLVSDEISIPIEEKGKVLLYPNPVNATSDLNIVTNGQGTFLLTDLMGRSVLNLELKESLKSIDILNLPNGLYVYQLLENNQVKDSGRLLKY